MFPCSWRWAPPPPGSMSATPIQYGQKVDEPTLAKWRQKARLSEGVFVGLLDDGTAQRQAERRQRVSKTVAKVRHGVSVVASVSAFEDGAEEEPPSNRKYQLERPPTREFEQIARDRGRQTGFREGPAATHYRGGAFGDMTAASPGKASGEDTAVAAAAAGGEFDGGAESPTRAAARGFGPAPVPLYEVSLEDSLAAHLASTDIRKKPLFAGKTYGNLQTGPALELALQNAARAAAARKKAGDSRAQSAIDALMEQSGWSKEWSELLNASAQAREMDEVLRTSLLDLMGTGQRVAPTAGGGWGLPSNDAYKICPVMTPDGGHRSSKWALHGRRSPARKGKGPGGAASPTKWEAPYAKYHR